MRLALRPSMTPKPRLGHMDFTVRTVRAPPELLGAGRCERYWPLLRIQRLRTSEGYLDGRGRSRNDV